MGMSDKIKAFLEEKAHTIPKTKKEKDLASHAAPYDKITHKDVLVGRGVVKEEDAEQVTEAKATYCGRCGTTHVAPSNGGTCPALKEEDIQEKTLTPAELKKREEIAKAMERENPGMPMGKKMAIATAQAKKVAEEQELEEQEYTPKAKNIPFEGPYRKAGEVRKDQYGNVVKNRAKFLAKKALAAQEKKKQGVAEASWTAAASMHAATRKRDPQSQDPKHNFRVGGVVTTKDGKSGTVVFVDGEKIQVKGTNSYYPDHVTHHTASELKKGVAEGLNEMDKSAPQPGRDGRVSHSTYGSRDKKGSDYFKGKEAPGKPVTAKQMSKDALDILKKQGVAEGFWQDAVKKEEVEQMDENDLGLRGLVSTNPQSIPNYAYKTQKGKEKAAKKNVPALKSAIKSALGRHPKPNLPEEAEQIDELNRDTLIDYVGKAYADKKRQKGKNAVAAMTGTLDDYLKGAKKSDNRSTGITRAYARLNKKVSEEVEQIDEKFVIHKGKHEPGRASSLGGQTLHGVTVKDVYTDKKEAQAHADAINKGRGYKPEDHKNPLYGGVLYQVSPMKEEAEQMDEKLERDGPVRQSFDKFQFTIPHSDAAQKYSEKKVKERDAMNKANDPGADRKGLALSVIDTVKAIKKGYKKGVDNPVKQSLVGKKGFKEEVEHMEEAAKWRSSSAAKPDPDNDWDRSPKSTGGMRATSDTRGDTGGEYNHSSLENRRKAQVVAKTGKTTKASNTSLKNRIRANMAQKQNKPNLPEEVDQMEEAKDMTGALTKAIEKKTSGKMTTYRDKDGVLKMKKVKEEVEQVEEAHDWEASETPTAIKIHHTSPKGKKGSTMVFSARDAQAHEKELKQAGHKVTHRQLMYGEKGGAMRPVKEHVTYSQFVQKLEEFHSDK